MNSGEAIAICVGVVSLGVSIVTLISLYQEMQIRELELGLELMEHDLISEDNPMIDNMMDGLVQFI